MQRSDRIQMPFSFKIHQVPTDTENHTAAYQTLGMQALPEVQRIPLPY